MRLMRFLKSVLKYFLFFVIGGIVAIFFSATVASYYVIEHMAQKPPQKDEALSEEWINTNLAEVLRFGNQYSTELNLFDQVQQKVAAGKNPELCEVICNPSSFDQSRMKEERSQYLQNFYEQQGANALKDPVFQLKLKEIGMLSDLFPVPWRTLWKEVDERRTENPGKWEKLKWSLRLEVSAAKQASSLVWNWEHLNKESTKIQEVRDLIQSCHKGLRSVKETQQECRSRLSKTL